MFQRPISLAVVTACFALTACETDPNTGQQSMTRAGSGALIGGGTGAMLGALIGGRDARGAAIIGAGIGAIGGAAIGSYMDRQERELRARTANTGIEVERQGENINLRLPAGVTFDFNSAMLRPEFRASLDQVAQTLAAYPSTFVDVMGHTDSIGTDAANQRLSEQRAQTVADYLGFQGVNRARIAARGYGSRFPVASNDTEEGRAQNRRVEIRLSPVTEDDVNRRPGQPM